MAAKEKFSECHNAAVFEKNGEDHCAVCHKPCKLADPKEAAAAHEAEGRSVESVLAGSPDAGRPAAKKPVAEESDKDADESDAPAVSSKMKRADLEEIARKEGATDADIEACEEKSELVDLINERRA